MKTQHLESLVIKVVVRYKPLLKASELLLLLPVLIINPYFECHGVYGGGADDRVERQGRTGSSSVRPCDLVNHIDELLMALVPPRRRVSFLLSGVVSSSILRGDSETECLLEELVDDGLDDDDPFFLVKRLVVFFHMVAALSLTNIYTGFSTGNKAHINYLEYGL
jgi:hypothetical protein